MLTRLPSRNRWMWPSFGTIVVEVNDTIRPPCSRSLTGIVARRPRKTSFGRGERIVRVAVVEGLVLGVSGRMIGGRITARTMHATVAAPDAHATATGRPVNAL